MRFTIAENQFSKVLIGGQKKGLFSPGDRQHFRILDSR